MTVKKFNMLPEIAFVLVVCFCIGGGFTKRDTKIEGSVTDPNGAAIAHAEVKLKLIRCKCRDCPKPEECACCPDALTTETNEDGAFSFTVRPGTYSLRASVAGFKVTESEVEVNAGDTKVVKMSIGM